jgi:glutamine synthetase
MFHTFEEAAAFVEEQKIRMIDLKWCDLWGRWHHITVSARGFSPSLMSGGIGFDGSAVAFKSVNAGDMALIPDLATGFMDPFFANPTLSFICNIVEPDTKQPFRRDPREIVRRTQQYLRSTGIADSSRWGPEFEFFIFDQVRFSNGLNKASYFVNTWEADWEQDPADQGYQVPRHGGYHRIPPNDRLSDLRSQMSLLLEDAGIPVKYHHHEAGGPGHGEIETPMLELMQAADATMVIKYITKQVAFRAGQAVTFLPKPLFGEAGNGMHFHQHMFCRDVNVFYDASGPSLLSQMALYYIGGLLTHAPAVLAFTNPSTNSYRRLVPGFEAPVNCFFGSGDRSAAIRIPKYATQPDEVRMEFRPPDATCNPYLAMPAMLMAGIDGIKRQIDPTAAGFGPFDQDIFSWPLEKRSQIKSLPTSLEDAMKALEADHAFLLEGGVFDEDMIAFWVDAKIKEHRELQARPHPREVEMYFDF